jgi:pyridoxine 5-phosphate synthase
MIRLSVNVNKVATLRNSRGGDHPSVLEAVETCLAAGVPGITVHPRHDQRHITTSDVHDIAQRLSSVRPSVDYNIEGDPRPEWMKLVRDIRPDQATLVPVLQNEITSQAGWGDQANAQLKQHVAALKSDGIRVSVFIDPTPDAVKWAKDLGADRVELFTGPFAHAFTTDRAEAVRIFETHVTAANLAHDLGMGINAGHDLDLANLPLFRTLPHLNEVSIGHALISRALFVGLETVVHEYLTVLRG